MRSENTPRPYAADMPRIDQPIAGYYGIILVKNGPVVGARIWYGNPLDPVTHEELDRSPRWMALRNGHECDYTDLWPWCAGKGITKAEYDHLLAVQAWAVEHAPTDPAANPRVAVDPLTAPLPW